MLAGNKAELQQGKGKSRVTFLADKGHVGFGLLVYEGNYQPGRSRVRKLPEIRCTIQAPATCRSEGAHTQLSSL